MNTTSHKSKAESTPHQAAPTVCSPCSEVAALIIDLNDPGVCAALQCLISRAKRVDPADGPQRKLYSLDLLTVPQVAEMLHKSETWVRRHSRELGVITLGGCGRGSDLLFSRAAIKGYLRRHASPELQGLLS